eukprot:scaffold3750_cov168-Skeletonema_marinoi.AAC.2
MRVVICPPCPSAYYTTPLTALCGDSRSSSTAHAATVPEDIAKMCANELSVRSGAFLATEQRMFSRSPTSDIKLYLW